MSGADQPGWSPWAPRPGDPPRVPPARHGPTPAPRPTTPPTPPLAHRPQPPTSWPLPRIARSAEQPGRRHSPALIGFVAALTGSLLMGLVFAGYVLGRGGTPRPAAVVTRSRIGALDVHRILGIAQPSVVTIQTGVKHSIYGAAGSGVVISQDGLILTNDHVTANASRIVVQFDDGSHATAQIVGASPADDIALLRADRVGLTPATLGSSDAIRVGDDVVAIGNALNLGGSPSVTRGIVSAKERSIPTKGSVLDHLIQTDAAINPGNSGGPLVNVKGEVVGINTAIIADAQNIGFSIAIDSVKALIGDLKAGKGVVTPPSLDLGVDTIDVASPDLSQVVKDRYGVTALQGAYVQAVADGSPAADAGLEQGDVISEIDGRPITGSAAVRRAMATHAPGDHVMVTVERSGRRYSFDVKLPG
ncbi:MAG: protease family protein [Acidimicrobiales bacterium]|nr:protease family protein [Acidimicrobiales bacterium]